MPLFIKTGVEYVKEYFPEVKKLTLLEDKFSTNLGFRHYNPDEIVNGKKMKDHLRFSMAYWHTLCATGVDPFGIGTAERPWLSTTNRMKMAEERVHAGFELMSKLGIKYFCFHDRDIVGFWSLPSEFHRPCTDELRS